MGIEFLTHILLITLKYAQLLLAEQLHTLIYFSGSFARYYLFQLYGHYLLYLKAGYVLMFNTKKDSIQWQCLPRFNGFDAKERAYKYTH